MVAVEYRKAPEHRFPAAHQDAFAAYRWAVRTRRWAATRSAWPWRARAPAATWPSTWPSRRATWLLPLPRTCADVPGRRPTRTRRPTWRTRRQAVDPRHDAVVRRPGYLRSQRTCRTRGSTWSARPGLRGLPPATIVNGGDRPAALRRRGAGAADAGSRRAGGAPHVPRASRTSSSAWRRPWRIRAAQDFVGDRLRAALAAGAASPPGEAGGMPAARRRGVRARACVTGRREVGNELALGVAVERRVEGGDTELTDAGHGRAVGHVVPRCCRSRASRLPSQGSRATRRGGPSFAPAAPL